MDLSEIIIARIQNEGPISFRDFMEMALYYPGLGYYNAVESKIGAAGDYYTSPVLSSLFGEMIGRQMEEMWMLMEKKSFTIVEYGAGTGALCGALLNYLKTNKPLYEALRYIIVEKSDSMREKQKQRFPEKVSWCSSIAEAAPVNGCVLSNEVLDNFAVHKVQMQHELKELFVDYKNGFVEISLPASTELKNYFSEQQIVLDEGFVTEVNLDALQWQSEIARALASGFVLTIDYGFDAAQLYSDKRREGTLICYKNHQVNNNIYADVGGQDITAHVNFSALAHWGRKAGLECMGYTSQANFLRALGLMHYLRKLETEALPENKNPVLEINKLLVEMGGKFKVLIQKKNIKSRFLTGLQFGNPCP